MLNKPDISTSSFIVWVSCDLYRASVMAWTLMIYDLCFGSTRQRCIIGGLWVPNQVLTRGAICHDATCTFDGARYWWCLGKAGVGDCALLLHIALGVTAVHCTLIQPVS